MKQGIKILALLVGFFLLWSCSPGGAPATTSKATIQAADFTNAEAMIIGLEKKWAEAIVNRDMGTLNEIIADDFTGTAWSGETAAAQV